MRPDQDIERVLLTPAQIRKGVSRLARKISRDYRSKDLVVVGVLKGSIVFLADLMRSLTIPCAVDFVSVSSYGRSARSGGVVRLFMDLRESPQGRHVLLVEDILDTGLTMEFLVRSIGERQPASLRICALLDKPENRKARMRADYSAFSIPNRFVVGYGLDYAERYRNLPYIGVLKTSAIARAT